jgi:lsr operon transcriptional repressor
MLSRVARLYYEHDLTHAQIAKIVGVSRVKVTRMLAEARRRGIVEITIKGDTHAFAELESRLATRLGLQDAWVVPTSADPVRLERSLGAGGAHCLRAMVMPRMTVGVNQSRTVAAIVLAVGSEKPVDAHFVPVSGSRGGAHGAKAHETSEALARAFEGRAHHVPAPVLASTADAAAVLWAESEIAETLALAARADLLVMGIGTLEDNHLTRTGAIAGKELGTLRRKGVVGDVSSRFFDRLGRPVPLAIDQRVIALTLEQHLAIPVRIAVAGGASKREALKAAAAGNLFNILVTDVETADWLVEQA